MDRHRTLSAVVVVLLSARAPRRRQRRRRALTLALGALIAPAAARAQSSRPCAPYDSVTANMLRLGALIVSDTTIDTRSFRARYGIPTGTSADVRVVQDTVVCESATAGAEAAGSAHQADALVTVRLGSASSFYLVTQRTALGGTDRIFLLNSRFVSLLEFR